MTIEDAINRFTATVIMFPTAERYLEKVSVVCTPAHDGFEVAINEIPFFAIGKYAFDEIPTFAYCAICIMRAFYLEDIERRAG